MTSPTKAPAAKKSPIGFGATVLDTPDPGALARFYAELLGWRVTEADDDWAVISGDGGELMFQQAQEFRPSTWPDAEIPQQFHLDLEAPDLEAAEAYALSIGAVRRRTADEPSDRFRVFVDPSGHPFCLCISAAPQD
ncbi:VOC family protein [Microlunatus soli]|uniref:VOC domain-containing protein n=1 Tax=Microlunatus soli TaxID=630515 RepID=A0A1H1QFD4_9ACTN|nr:VOC family protein [Microlunatus soli]SDS22182.1 hypothetical protein SAMN04489812_1252 [Microlunatus soli]